MKGWTFYVSFGLFGICLFKAWCYLKTVLEKKKFSQNGNQMYAASYLVLFTYFCFIFGLK